MVLNLKWLFTEVCVILSRAEVTSEIKKGI